MHYYLNTIDRSLTKFILHVLYKKYDYIYIYFVFSWCPAHRVLIYHVMFFSQRSSETPSLCTVPFVTKNYFCVTRKTIIQNPCN